MWEKVYENNTQHTSIKRLIVRDIVWVIEYWKVIFHNKMSLNFSPKVSYNKQQNYIQNNQQKKPTKVCENCARKNYNKNQQNIAWENQINKINKTSETLGFK